MNTTENPPVTQSTTLNSRKFSPKQPFVLMGIVAATLLILFMAGYLLMRKNVQKTEQPKIASKISSPENFSAEYMILSVSDKEARAFGNKGELFVPNHKSTTIYANLPSGKTQTNFSALKPRQLVQIQVTKGKTTAVTILNAVEEKKVTIQKIEIESERPDYAIAVSNPTILRNSLNKEKWINSYNPITDVKILLTDVSQANTYLKIQNISVISTAASITGKTITIKLYVNKYYIEKEDKTILSQFISKALAKQLLISLNPTLDNKELAKKADDLSQNNMFVLTSK